MVMRLDKYLSNAGYGSRSQIKKLIRNGIIRVNKQICEDASMMVCEEDTIYIDNTIATSKPASTLMMNKPEGYVSSNISEAGYPSVLELIHQPHPIYSIAGRLDVDTTGLLILCTDGKLVHDIIHPKKEITKTYIATVEHFDPSYRGDFFKGLRLSQDLFTKPVTHFEILAHDLNQHIISIGIIEGKFHQVKKMFESVGAIVVKLKRNAIGFLKLDEGLIPGNYKELSSTEIEKLFE